jgi:SAM-dependent methyltransferase
MKTDNQRAWNIQATRYFKQANLSYDVVDYGDPHCETDETLHLLPDVSGKNVLELGCGGGNIGIVLAKRGAQVIAVDISEAQLQIARQKAQEQGVSVRYIESAIETLDFAPLASVDLVISVCALQYVPDLAVVFKKIYATLAPAGTFIFSTDDPIFSSVAARFLWNDSESQQSYFYDGPETWKWEEGDDFAFTTYRHPIDFYINALNAAGFTVEKFHQLRNQTPDPASAEEQFEQLYPRIMVFKCRK